MTAFTPEILRFDSLASTNAEAARQAVDCAPEGLCVVASEQTAGRGRLQRRWVSPKDAGLYFSIILRPTFEQNAWPLLTLMASLAVHDALIEACTLETDIKWPNDILVDDRKLCGILAETVETELGRSVIVGIGINLTRQAFPLELYETATSVESATGSVPDREVVLQCLIAGLKRRYEMLHSPAGGKEMVQAWSARSSYANGKRVRVASGEETLEGTTRGLEHDGALRVETGDGQIRIVRAGDVTAVRPFVAPS